jgi:hypothetical protein
MIKWFLALIALLEISGAFIVLTLGDLMAVLRGRYPLDDNLSDWDTRDRS